MDWLEREVDGIKDVIMQMADHIRTQVESKLDDILYEVRQQNGIW